MHTVDLVHITPDAEQLVAYMARVSNPCQPEHIPRPVAKLIRLSNQA